MCIIFAFVWLLLSVVAAVYATSKYHSGTDFFIIALLISPLGAGVLAAFLPPVDDLKTSTHDDKMACDPSIVTDEADWQDAVRFVDSVREAVEKLNDSVPLAQVDSAIDDLRSLYFQSGEAGVTSSAINMLINEAKYRELEAQQQASIWK
ncbi:hypothetical protein LRP52_49100 [Photobacterium sp. ZSDE20]|uniref:Uncharacterized protein n=1 Tax=Photobacterium pectinilyticum TaxID=2906793 RepID=A0ABT1N9G1_9GAMM|nr:hypothetical protein [Photobacterium sp. ZSDE20]MCQ1061372.1 hypothetical protein [Photobacterium sp. ZSDE20]MDD1830096.1 hypothetical protein [Photobacterium sp. ZSDE20]